MFSIALAGLGTVGTHVVRQLQDNAALIAARAGQNITIRAVSGRDKSKPRDCNLNGITWVDDAAALATMPGIDAVVEVIGGAEGVARQLAETALTHGKHLVTANKALLAKHGAALAHSAEQHRRSIMYEAAVAGGIPVIKMLREALAGDEVVRVRGILNGTCNYILTRMRDAKLDLASALREAQEHGFAEADPTADIEGHDTAHKLALLAALAFGMAPDLATMNVVGITPITGEAIRAAEAKGMTIKLLGIAEKQGSQIIQRVETVRLPHGVPLAEAQGAMNVIEIETRRTGTLTLQGLGAGGSPTANAVVADIIDLARGNRPAYAFGVPAKTWF